MENEENTQLDTKVVSYFVFESVTSRMERECRRLWITTLVLITLLVVSNLAWFAYEQSFEDVVVTQENSDGYNNYIGNDGDIVNGEADR